MALLQKHIRSTLEEYKKLMEREIGWGVEAGELRHLSGRIGELFVADITNGTMAIGTNQYGYDVKDSKGKRVSVKTFCAIEGKTSRGGVSFNDNTFDEVDRVSIVRIDIENKKILKISELINCSKKTIEWNSVYSRGRVKFRLSSIDKLKPARNAKNLKKTAFWKNYKVVQCDDGRIEVYKGNELQEPSKPVLIELAKQISVTYLSKESRNIHTRKLGLAIIRKINDESSW